MKRNDTWTNPGSRGGSDHPGGARWSWRLRIGHHSSKPSASNIQVDSINDMLSGIPQKGIELGSPNAKLTMVEFADPQCPYCGDLARNAFPSLVQNYVRTGKFRIEYAGLAFARSTDSTRLLRLAQAAGLQNKLWNVVELEYENQGTENSGYATDPFLKAIAKAVPGLDANKALATWNTSAVAPMIDAAQALAEKRFGNDISTPSFLLGLDGLETNREDRRRPASQDLHQGYRRPS